MENVNVPKLLWVLFFNDLVAEVIGRGDHSPAAFACMEEGLRVDYLSDGIVDDISRDDAVIVRLDPGIDPERLDAHDFFLLVAHGAGDVHHIEDEGVAFGTLLGFPREVALVLVYRNNVGIQRVIRAGRDLPLEGLLISAFEMA